MILGKLYNFCSFPHEWNGANNNILQGGNGVKWDHPCRSTLLVHVMYSVLINNNSQTFSHYYDLNLIYIKAPLQMTSKDALASLNSIHTKLITTTFSTEPANTVAGLWNVALSFRSPWMSSQPEHCTVTALLPQTSALFFTSFVLVTIKYMK